MPRNVDPGTIQVGKGLAPEGTVEDNALRYPERDVDPLRVHIHDPSRAHMAATIGIVDANDCYVSDEVEGALQELCSNSGAGRLNGLIAGGTFTELGCVANGGAGGVHATLTLCAPTEIMMNGTVLDAAGLTVSLPAANTIYFIYLDTQATSPTYRELVATTVGPPQVEEGDPDATTGPGSIEQVMLAKITVGGGGNITAWQDARFFVRNLDRKVTYSSRQGENVDAWSEGCFANLQAFFFWAEYYGDGALASSNEEEKGTVMVRGTHTITAPLVVPTDHLQFVGDGEAIILLTGVGAPYAAIETTKSDVTFRNLKFVTNLSQCVGIAASGNYSDLTIEDCQFVSGTGDFATAISAIGGPANVRILIRDCYMEASDMGVQADGFGSTSAFGIKAEDCTIKGLGTASSKGFVLGTGTTNGSAYIMGCSIKDMETGIRLQETSNTEISGCSITEAVTGIQFVDGTTALTHKITNNTIVLTDNLSLHGIYVGKGNTQIDISGNYVRSLVSGNQPSEPYGIALDAGVGYEVLGLTVTNNNVIGFYDATNNRGHGIAVFCTGAQGTGASITGNTLSRCDIAVTQVSDLTITGNSINAQGVWSGSPGPTVGAGISTATASLVTITGNNISCGAVIPNGIEVRQGRHLTVTGNNVLAPTDSGILASATLVGGAGDAFMEHFTITGNTVDGWRDVNTAPTANGILVGLSSDNGAPERGVLDGNTIQKCAAGILLRGFSEAIPINSMLVSNNMIRECAENQTLHDSAIWAQAGSKGIGVDFGEYITITGNQLTLVGSILNPATGTPLVFPNFVYVVSIYALSSGHLNITGNTLAGARPQAGGGAGVPPWATDILVRVGGSATYSGANQVQIHGNMINVSDTVLPGGHEAITVWAAKPNGPVVHIEDLSILDNSIQSTGGVGGDGVGVGITVLSAGYSSISGVIIQGNTVESYLSKGISVDTGITTPVGPSDMLNVVIQGNTMRSMNASGPQSGVFASVVTDTTFVARVYSLSIRDNSVHGRWGHGIRVVGSAQSSTTGYIGMDGITVSGNQVDNLQISGSIGSAGFYARIDGGAQERVLTNFPAWDVPGVSNIRVADNQFTKVSRAFDIESTEVLSHNNMVIEDNQFSGLGTNTGTDDYLSRFSSLLTDNTSTQSIGAFSISGNTMLLAEGQNRGINNLRIDTNNAYLDVVSVQGNVINASGNPAIPNAHGKSIYFRMTAVPLNALAITKKNIVISGNTLGGGLAWDQANADLISLDIHGNQITIPYGDAATPYSAPLWLNIDGADVDGHVLQGLAIRGNSVTGGVYGINVVIDDIEMSQGVSITDNTVQDTYLGAVRLGIDQNSTLFLSEMLAELKVNNNTIDNTTTSGALSTGILYAAGRASTVVCEFNGNQILNQDVRAIWCQVSGSTSAPGPNRGLQISNNTIESCGFAAFALPLIAVETDPDITLLPGPYTGVSLCGNMILKSGWSTGSTGIYVDLTPYEEVFGLKVDDNSMSAPGNPLVNSQRLGAGIELDLPTTTGMTVDNNLVTVSGFDGATTGYGIYVQFIDSRARGVSISENIIRLGGTGSDSWEADYGIRVRSGSSFSMSISDVAICGNQISGDTNVGDDPIGTWGINWTGDDGDGLSGSFDGVHIDNNVVTDLKTGIWVELQDLGMAHTSMPQRDCSMDGNNIRNCTLDGVSWAAGGPAGKSGNIHGFSASRNSVITRHLNNDGSSGTVGHPMVHVAFGRGILVLGAAESVSIHQVSLDNNHCYLTTQDTDDRPWSGVVLQAAVANWDGAAHSISEASTLSMHSNHVRNVGLIGVGLLAYGTGVNDGVEWTNVSRVRTSTVSDNLVKMSSFQTSPGNTNRSGGILLWFNTISLDQFQFQGNAVRGTDPDNGPVALQVYGGYVGAFTVPAAKFHQNLTVTGNNITSFNDTSIDVVWVSGSAGVPVSGITSNNANTTCTTAANNFVGGKWIFVGPSFHSLSSNIQL